MISQLGNAMFNGDYLEWKNGDDGINGLFQNIVLEEGGFMVVNLHTIRKAKGRKNVVKMNPFSGRSDPKN